MTSGTGPAWASSVLTREAPAASSRARTAAVWSSRSPFAWAAGELPGTTTCSRCSAHPARPAASTAYRRAGPASSSSATRMGGLSAGIEHLTVRDGCIWTGATMGCDRGSQGRGRHALGPAPAPSLAVDERARQ